MKKILVLLLLVGATLSSCMKQELDEIRDRLSNLEEWQQSINSDITSLKSLIEALEANDFVTGVTPLSDRTGYVIEFVRRSPITIKHGNGGETIVVSAKQDTDGKYYWTIGSEWLLYHGTKVTATDNTAQVRANDQTKMWEVSVDAGTTWIRTDIKAENCSIFTKDGIDNTHDDYVVLTLADGTTKITLPKATSVAAIGFESYELFMGSAGNTTIPIVLPQTLKEADYTAIVATVTNESGTGTDIQTRSAATENTWGVKVTKPTFTNGVLVAGSAKVTLTPPADIKLAETAMLKVTITDKRGRELSVTRPVKYFDGQIVASTAGNLSNVATNTQVTKLALKGTLNADDFAYIRQSLTALELLDLSMTDLTNIPDYALRFQDDGVNTTLTRVIIPASVTTIGPAAFYNCRALESIDLVNTETLGRTAFYHCVNLRSVKLGNKLTQIDSQAFKGCSGLTAIDIPASVRSLGTWGFQDCENLQTITLHEGLRTLARYAFAGSGVVSINIPSTITTIPNYTFENCTKLERITMHDKITSIGDYAFDKCQSLKSIRIPNGTTTISTGAFRACSNLQYITLHDNITEIQQEAFADCVRLEGATSTSGFTLPASLSTLGSGAFMNCGSLLSVDMSSSTTIGLIPERLFADCSKLHTVQLPDAVEFIDESAFARTDLSSFTLPAGVTRVGQSVFVGCKRLTQFFARPATPPSIDQDAFDPSFKTACTLFVPENADYTSWGNYFKNIAVNLP